MWDSYSSERSCREIKATCDYLNVATRGSLTAFLTMPLCMFFFFFIKYDLSFEPITMKLLLFWPSAFLTFHSMSSVYTDMVVSKIKRKIRNLGKVNFLKQKKIFFNKYLKMNNNILIFYSLFFLFFLFYLRPFHLSPCFLLHLSIFWLCFIYHFAPVLNFIIKKKNTYFSFYFNLFNSSNYLILSIILFS